ncbi:MAG: DegT/DnrJ/EryC1/StrS family aminotransferase [Chloroflexota bacterium]|nr:DegT/DnrJ/EryC1/StrS family aminotransferase [Chloroflexota bacterium]
MIAEHLAVDGGAPVRAERLPFHRPCVEDDEIAEVVDALRGGWLTTGPRCRRFEQELAAYVGAKHAVAVNSATAALHLALEAIGLRAGDEVIVPTYTFTATAEVVLYFGARPVLVDVDRRTLNLDPAAVEAAIGERTRAIVTVDMGGVPCDYDALGAIAARHNLIIVDDAAHAIPSRYKGRMIGSVADLTAFSFYVTKPLATGEGGMLVTDDDDYAERARIMRLHGMSRDAWKRYTAEGSWYYEVVAPGFKYNLTDLAAALGLRQLAKQDRFRAERARVAARYDAAFRDWPELEVPFVPDDVETSWHLYILRLELDRLRVDRARVIEALAAENIATSVHFIPLHLHPWYREQYGFVPESFPSAYAEYRRAISLPIFPGMTDEDVEDVIAAVHKVVGHYRR